MLTTPNAREIAAVLLALGIEVNFQTRRAACVLHGGSNRSAFSWTDTGLWKCHSCGAGGDLIELIRAARNCGFAEARAFLEDLSGVRFARPRASAREIEQARIVRERAVKAGWRVRDEVLRLRSYYRDGLHRTECLMTRMRKGILHSGTAAEQEAVWERMARLASASTFFLAAYDSLCRADAATLTRFALATARRRRVMIFGGSDADTAIQAA